MAHQATLAVPRRQTPDAGRQCRVLTRVTSCKLEGSCKLQAKSCNPERLSHHPRRYAVRPRATTRCIESRVRRRGACSLPPPPPLRCATPGTPRLEGAILSKAGGDRFFVPCPQNPTTPSPSVPPLHTPRLEGAIMSKAGGENPGAASGRRGEPAALSGRRGKTNLSVPRNYPCLSVFICGFIRPRSRMRRAGSWHPPRALHFQS
jgi:hypothetical protein